MYDQNGEAFYEINNLHEATYVKIDEINEYVIKAFVETEDRRFYQHQGFDIYRIIQAFFHNITHKSTIGASTITQQYVKNIYLSNEQSLIRKIREIYYAIKLERIYDKDEILEGYLNTIYFNHGIYGIYDAAKYYFNKEPKDLTLAEAASLAAIIKAPATYAPDINLESNIQRQHIILNSLYDRNVISLSEYNTAINQELIVTKTKYQHYNNGTLFFKDLILSELNNGGYASQNLEVYTTFDSILNEHMENTIHKNIACNYAIVVISNSQEILAIVGNNNYLENPYNIATLGARMIGSTIKPMLYYEALESNMTALSKFTSRPETIYLNKQPYIFKNYNNNYENQPITMAYAIATSDNIYAIKTHLYLGSNKLISFLKGFGISDIENYPSLALGTVDMSLLKLTSIYNTFSTLGIYQEPYLIKEIKSNQKTIYKHIDQKKRLLSEASSFIISDLLTGTFDTNLSHKISVTGASIADKINTKVAGKSGLTDYDSYFVGYTPLYTIGVWSGYLDNRLLNDDESKRYPKNIFLSLINYLMKSQQNVWYEKPSGVTSLFVDPTGFNTGYKKTLYFKS